MVRVRLLKFFTWGLPIRWVGVYRKLFWQTLLLSSFNTHSKQSGKVARKTRGGKTKTFLYTTCTQFRHFLLKNYLHTIYGFIEPYIIYVAQYMLCTLDIFIIYVFIIKTKSSHLFILVNHEMAQQSQTNLVGLSLLLTSIIYTAQQSHYIEKTSKSLSFLAYSKLHKVTSKALCFNF